MAKRKSPRASSNETKPSENKSGSQSPMSEAVAQRAFDLYLARGGQEGHDLEDWLQAEREILFQRQSVN